MKSLLQDNPKSKVIEKGYINVYSELNIKERRQLSFKRRYKKENPLWDETMVYLSNVFASLCKQDSTVLDAGCGNGNYIIDENRAKIGWAFGVDVSIDETAKNICLDDLKFASLEKLPFEDNKFDLVVSLWVFEHLENPKIVFQEIYRVLKPNGYFLFATPNSSYFPIKLVSTLKYVKVNHFLNKVLFGREEKEIFPTYYRANTIKDLAKANQSQFNIKEIRLNSDISYTSFNEPTYFLSKILLKLPKMFSYFTYPHIIGILKKP